MINFGPIGLNGYSTVACKLSYITVHSVIFAEDWKTYISIIGQKHSDQNASIENPSMVNIIIKFQYTVKFGTTGYIIT